MLIVRDEPRFMQALRKRDSVSALCLQFTVLTATRLDNVHEALWDEINFGGEDVGNPRFQYESYSQW